MCKNTMTDSEHKIIRESLTRLLARREHSQSELEHKLLGKGFSRQAIQQQLQQFTQAGLQSDQRYAESQIRNRVAQGYGLNRIMAELREHQLDDHLINSTLQEQQIDWFVLAEQAYHKKYAATQPKNWQEKQKRMRFLQYRGFTLEQINYVLGT